MEVRHQSLTLVVLSMLVAGCPSNTDWSWSGLAESGDKASESESTAPKPEPRAKPAPPKVEASATWTPRTPSRFAKRNFLRDSGSSTLRSTPTTQWSGIHGMIRPSRAPSQKISRSSSPLGMHPVIGVT